MWYRLGRLNPLHSNPITILCFPALFYSANHQSPSWSPPSSPIDPGGRGVHGPNGVHPSPVPCQWNFCLSIIHSLIRRPRCPDRIQLKLSFGKKRNEATNHDNKRGTRQNLFNGHSPCWKNRRGRGHQPISAAVKSAGDSAVFDVFFVGYFEFMLKILISICMYVCMYVCILLGGFWGLARDRFLFLFCFFEYHITFTLDISCVKKHWATQEMMINENQWKWSLTPCRFQ